MQQAIVVTLHHSPSQACKYMLYTQQKQLLKITEEELGIIKHQAQDDITGVPQIVLERLKQNIQFLRKNNAKVSDRTVQVRRHVKASLPQTSSFTAYVCSKSVQCAVDIVTAV